MTDLGKLRLILVLAAAVPACGSAQSQPVPSADKRSIPPADAATTAAAPAPRPDAGPIEATIPTCHRFCQANHEHGCGHWERAGRGRSSPRAIAPSAPRWLTCDPACCDPSIPSRVEAAPVALADLVAVLSFATASSMISSLGGQGISVYCPSSGWEPTATGERESAPCPAGRVALGELTAALTMVVTRQIDDPSIAVAVLMLSAESDSGAWSGKMRNMLAEQSGHNGGSGDVFALGEVTAKLEPARAATPARLHLSRLRR